jgi:MoxR-like ATPase
MDIKNIPQVLIENIEKVIVGKPDVIELLLVGLFSSGHILIEDVPGTGKTTLTRALAKSIKADFKRIQFTPDLLPTDITGVYIYNQKIGNFEFKKGPIFTNVLLADEINRTTPRTQSGLLEAMQEMNVTVDGITHQLPAPFFVVATQNPVEYEGTYQLPEAQLDRFLMKIKIGYPSKPQEQLILKDRLIEDPISKLQPVISVEDLLSVQKAIHQVHVSDNITSYMIDLIGASRNYPEVRLGISPRGSLALMQASRALAFLNKRDFVVPSDIKHLAPFVLGHRMIIKTPSLIRGVTSHEVISNILERVPILDAQ